MDKTKESKGTTEKIQTVLEKEVNSYLKLHSGSCELLDFDDGIVTIRMHGGCSGCPSSQSTLLNGILPILKEKIPEIEDVTLE